MNLNEFKLLKITPKISTITIRVDKKKNISLVTDRTYFEYHNYTQCYNHLNKKLGQI